MSPDKPGVEDKKKYHRDQVLLAARKVASGEWAPACGSNHREYHLRRLAEIEGRETCKT